jgi:hypothetical protein
MHTTSHYETRSTGGRLVALVILTLTLHPTFAFFQLAVYKALCHPPMTTSLFRSKVHRKNFQPILVQTIFPFNINLQFPLPNSLSFIMGSRHEAYPPEVWNYPLSENYLLTVRSHPMTPQYSNESYNSTTSSSYSSNESYFSGSPTYNDGHGGRHGSQSHSRHQSNGALYDEDNFCVSPTELQTPTNFPSRHVCSNTIPSHVAR